MEEPALNLMMGLVFILSLVSSPGDIAGIDGSYFACCHFVRCTVFYVANCFFLLHCRRRLVCVGVEKD